MFFWTLNIPHIDEKTQKPQYLHVKPQNTRKNRWHTIKMGENTLFLRLKKYWKYIRGLLSRSHFPFSRFQNRFLPLLPPNTCSSERWPNLLCIRLTWDVDAYILKIFIFCGWWVKRRISGCTPEPLSTSTNLWKSDKTCYTSYFF